MRGRRARATAAEAVYARFLDGDHMWLAVRNAESLTLTLPDGTALPVPSEPGDDAGVPVAVVRFDVAAALAADDSPELSLPLLSGGRNPGPVLHAAHRRRGPVLPAPVTRDGRWRLNVGKEQGTVVVVRSRAEPMVAVRGFRAEGGDAWVRLATTATRARLVLAGRVLAELPVNDGELVLGDVLVADLARHDGLDLSEPAIFEVEGQPLGRPHNLLRAANAAVLLPPLPGDLELRWVAGCLGVRRRGETP